MKRHNIRAARRWLLLAMVIALLGIHALLPYALSHVGLSATVVSGVVLLIVIKHLGLFTAAAGPLYAIFRRRSRH